jgi:hypothetical protein
LIITVTAQEPLHKVVREALDEARLLKDLRMVEDGEELRIT